MAQYLPRRKARGRLIDAAANVDWLAVEHRGRCSQKEGGQDVMMTDGVGFSIRV
jgi:hypothetical protein